MSDPDPEGTLVRRAWDMPYRDLALEFTKGDPDAPRTMLRRAVLDCRVADAATRATSWTRALAVATVVLAAATVVLAFATWRLADADNRSPSVPPTVVTTTAP